MYRGASTSLIGDRLDATHYHGRDGLGDANLAINVTMDQIQKEHAVSALIRLVNQLPGTSNDYVHGVFSAVILFV